MRRIYVVTQLPVPWTFASFFSPRVEQSWASPFTMQLSIHTVASALLLVGVVSAQTPAGFVPEVKDKLEIIFGSKAVDTPGASLAKAGE